MILLDPDARPVIAHRGASGQYPENTHLAFAKALEQGADALELDVRVTSDGVPIVLHDATLDRTTDGTGAVAALSLRQVRQAVAGAGERVPTLAEVLERFATTPLVVEIKEPRAAQPTLAALRTQRAEGRVLLGAFLGSLLRPFVGTEFARSAVRVEVAWFWACARVGLAPLGGVAALTVPERWRGLRVVDSAFLEAARRRALPVHVWTVNDPAEAARLRALGVCGIMTDYPERMRDL